MNQRPQELHTGETGFPREASAAMRIVAEPNLFGESSETPGRERSNPEGGPRV